MKAPDFIMNIDWKQLREQKLYLLQTGIETEPIDGIIHLLDALQDYAADELGLGEELVFGELTDEVKQPEPVWVCPHCGSKNVQTKAWVRPNENNKFVDLVDDSENYSSNSWCDDCEKHGILELKEE